MKFLQMVVLVGGCGVPKLQKKEKENKVRIPRIHTSTPAHARRENEDRGAVCSLYDPARASSVKTGRVPVAAS